MARPRVVLDANALMLPFQFRINLDSEIRRLLGECDVYVPGPIRRELERLARTNRRAKAAARLAAKYLAIESEWSGDAAVIDAAETLGAHVVTSDAALLAALRERRISTITLRSKTHLHLEA
ncbi:MAG TPA: twitching motility protein PilT [Thermoplasmata archaeon]|jgi:hypothetical protein|nr:twitching motility protein PilT [Thermoplasmata archaeon]